jgi:hypothetical protein
MLNHLRRFIRLSSVKRFAIGFVELEESQTEKVNSIFENSRSARAAVKLKIDLGAGSKHPKGLEENCGFFDRSHLQNRFWVHLEMT